MKRAMVTVNLRKVGDVLRGVKTLGGLFTVMTLATFCFFLLLGVFGIVQTKVNSSPVSSMKGFAGSVSSQFFVDLMGMEIPDYTKDSGRSTFSQKNISGFLFRYVTSINPSDPKTLMASIVPGMKSDEAILLRKGRATDLADAPEDFTPSKSSLTPQTETSADQHDGDPASGGKAADTPAKQGTVNPSPTGQGGSAASPGTTPAPLATGQNGRLTTNGKKVVFIYHSHNRESFIPELKGKAAKNGDANDASINVTLVGKRLASRLSELGIGAVDSGKDYPSLVKGFNWNFSYKYSRTTVKDAFQTYPDLKFLFDIHRDSQPRSKTTAKIGGKSYAQVYFIIGHKNPNWRKNEQFATKIHKELEAKLPGISRGIWGKTAASGNGEYNQSLSPNNILIEIGGVENTLEETYRTADVLAGIIAKLYWQAEKVNAPSSTARTVSK